MPRKGTPIDPEIKCPWCEAIYPDLRRNGYYKRDKYAIPQYYCKKCKRGFSSSVVKVKILQPPYEVEIGYRVKVEAIIEAERGLGVKEVKCRILIEEKVKTQLKLEKDKESIYKSIWDIEKAEPGKYILELIVEDFRGGSSVHRKAVKVVQHYDTLIWEIASKYKINTFLIKGMIWKESSFNPEVESSANAKGLTQLTPITLEELKKEKYGHLEIKNPFDPRQNIQGGVCYLGGLIERFGDIRLALGAYNWGPENVMRKAKKQENKFPKSVREHIVRVLELKKVCETNYLKYYESKQI